MQLKIKEKLMKEIKTLKQKICLGICAVSGLAIVGGFTLFGIGAVEKNNKVEEFRKSAEYKQTISQELLDAKNKYQASNPTLENLEEYYNTSTAIYSLEHAEDILKNSTTKQAKEYKSSIVLRNVGGAIFATGVTALAMTGTLGFPMKTKKENVEESQITK